MFGRCEGAGNGSVRVMAPTTSTDPCNSTIQNCHYVVVPVIFRARRQCRPKLERDKKFGRVGESRVATMERDSSTTPSSAIEVPLLTSI